MSPDAATVLGACFLAGCVVIGVCFVIGLKVREPDYYGGCSQWLNTDRNGDNPYSASVKKTKKK